MDPSQINPQMLAYYKSQFPGQVAMGMGNAPGGTTQSAGAGNAVSKLVLALMQQKASQKYKQQYPQQGAQNQQGQTLAAPPPSAGDFSGSTDMGAAMGAQ